MEQRTKEAPQGRAKEPYVKPDFRCEPVFAVAALQCGKVNATQLTCHQILKAS